MKAYPCAVRHLAPPAHPEGEVGSRRVGFVPVDLYIGPLNQSSCRRVLKNAFHESQESWQGSPLTHENDHKFTVGLCHRADVKNLPKHPRRATSLGLTLPWMWSVSV